MANWNFTGKKKRVSRSGRPIDLRPTEYRLLEVLMERPGRVYTREQLLNGLWGHDVYIDERTVDVHVGRLRKAINRGKEPGPIRTVRGSGYGLDDRFGNSGASAAPPLLRPQEIAVLVPQFTEKVGQ